jgi:hypothetical protein
LLAGGAVEVAAWLLQAVVSSSVDGAPWSSVADMLASSCSRLLGVVECANPSLVADRRRFRVFEDLEGGGGDEQDNDDGRAGWRFYGTKDRRLPVQKGAISIQGLCCGAAAARHRSVMFFINVVRIQKDLVVIFSLF